MTHTTAAASGVDPEALYRRFGPMVYRRCRRLLGHEEAAVDAMHDVFVKVIARQDVLTAEAPSSLLYRMATNTCLNVLRTKRRRPEVLDGELLLRIAVLDDAEDRTAARLVLAKLFRREQESTATIAVMHLLDGMTHQEVADAVGMSVSGVRKRLRVLRARLHTMEAEAQAPAAHHGRMS